MQDIAVSVKNISKKFRLFNSPKERLKEALHPFDKKYHKEFWALKDVSFDVPKGQTLGIVGRNGSGKSTLLQILCSILQPTSGEVAVNGTISALLELGSGFNPEFTGRQNVFMKGMLMGFSREEIKKRLPAIEAFADIGEFIDQPIKIYSSGMSLRLAFAVAINVDPDILIIDEALSVGDELFQRKCFSRIEALRASGATILFVSHSSNAIVELCDRALLMDAGEKLTDGNPKQVVGRYQKLLYAPVEKYEFLREQIRQTDEQPLSASESTEKAPKKLPDHSAQESFDPNLRCGSTIHYESSGAHIESPAVITLAGDQVNNLIRGKRYIFTYSVRFSKDADYVHFGMLIKTVSGVELGGGVTAKSYQDRVISVKEGESYRVTFNFLCALNPGFYFLNAGVSGISGGVDGYLHRILDSMCIRVIGHADGFSNGFVDFDIVPLCEISK